MFKLTEAKQAGSSECYINKKRNRALCRSTIIDRVVKLPLGS